jgi:hypothetical protein
VSRRSGAIGKLAGPQRGEPLVVVFGEESAPE